MIEAQTTPSKVSFAVDEVLPSQEALPKIASRQALERILKAKIIACPGDLQPVVQGEEFHPLIAAAALAFKQHYPLILSPDMLWLAVLQGTAQHINNHAETLRPRLVDHQGKIELVNKTDVPELPTDDAAMLALVKDFTAAIAVHIHSDKRFLLDAEFSTTVDVARIAYAVSLMDTFQAYFDYVFECICGIPSITLEGTVEDWKLLAAKVDLIHRSDLDLAWWTSQLQPLCQQFVQASRGEIDQVHWKDIFKLKKHYGFEELNGWLLKFIPYIRYDSNEPPVHRNPLLDLEVAPRADTEPDSSEKIGGCISKWLPNGLSSAPVTCKMQQPRLDLPMRFVAGFVGVHQSAGGLGLRPAISWAIVESIRIDALIARLRSEHSIEPPKQIELSELVSIFSYHLPADFWRFYTQTNGATISFRDQDASDLVRGHIYHVYCSISAMDQLNPIFDVKSVENELKLLLKRFILTPNEFKERRDFAWKYSRFRVFASGHENGKTISYLFGADPEEFDSELQKVRASRGTIFRWDGELTPESFVPVAHTFSDWLEMMLDWKLPAT